MEINSIKAISSYLETIIKFGDNNYCPSECRINFTNRIQPQRWAPLHTTLLKEQQNAMGRTSQWLHHVKNFLWRGFWFSLLCLPTKFQTENSYKKIIISSIHLPKYIVYTLRRTHLKNKAWGIYNSEIRTMCVFSSHHNWLRRNCSFSLLQKCFSSGLYDICYCRCQNNRTSIFFRILFLFSILNFEMEIES